MLHHLLLECWAQLSGPLNVLHKFWIKSNLFTHFLFVCFLKMFLSLWTVYINNWYTIKYSLYSCLALMLFLLMANDRYFTGAKMESVSKVEFKWSPYFRVLRERGGCVWFS